MNKKIYGLILAAAVPLSLLLYTLRKPTTSSNIFTVGMFVWAPFMTINPQGTYEGFDVDVAQELAKRMNKTLVIKDLGSLAPCFVALEQNSIDAIISDLDITQARLKKLNMIPYTGETVTSFTLLFWKNIPGKISTVNDLGSIKNPIICAEAGSAQEKFIDAYPFLIKKPMQAVTDMILDVKYGKSLALILEPRIAARYQQQEPGLVALPVQLPPDFQVYGCGIGISKQQPTLTKTIAILINDMKADGTLRMLEKRWELAS